MLLGRDAVWPFRDERGSLSLALVLSAIEMLIDAISRDSYAAKSDSRSYKTTARESSPIGPSSAAGRHKGRRHSQRGRSDLIRGQCIHLQAGMA